MAVGAGGAFTPGVNRLPPVGLIDFSVGSTVGGGAGVAGVVVVVVVVVVGVVVSGPFFSSVPHAAVNEIIPMTAAPPAMTVSRRVNCPDFMMLSSLCPCCWKNLAFGESRRIPTTSNASRGQSHPEAGSGERTLTEGPDGRRAISAGPVTPAGGRHPRLDAVGGWVFTRAIEHAFEQGGMQMVREVLS